MSKFNLKKSQKINDKKLEDWRKDFNLDKRDVSKNINSVISKKDKDVEDTIEKQISKDTDKKKTDLKVTEKNLNTNDKRKENKNKDLTLLNADTEKYHQEKLKKYKEENKVDDKDLEFWDKYTGLSTDKENIKDNSQLLNNENRFKNMKDSYNPEIKKTVMASLKDADAMLFHIYAKSQKESRDLTEYEKQMVVDINSGKRRLLAQMTLQSPQKSKTVEQDPLADIAKQDALRDMALHDEIANPEDTKEEGYQKLWKEINFDESTGPFVVPKGDKWRVVEFDEQIEDFVEIEPQVFDTAEEALQYYPEAEISY